MFSYDVDDPCIDVNVVFPDVDQCKLAVTHHAIMLSIPCKKTRQDLGPYARELNKAASGHFFASTSKKYARCKVNDDYLGPFCCKCAYSDDLFFYNFYAG